MKTANIFSFVDAILRCEPEAILNDKNANGYFIKTGKLNKIKSSTLSSE